VLCDVKAVKSDAEIDVMRWATKITVEGHVEVLRRCKPGMKECQLVAVFKGFCDFNYFTGKVAPYLPICGCDNGAATLHYVDNDRYIQDGKTMLTDQAISVGHYCSDITSSFPVNGKFTQKQKDIYNIVLKANQAVIAALRPGVSWVDMHLLAEKVILEGLRDLGLVAGDVDEMQNARLGYIFMPHGLGHLIGLDVHDAGGYVEGLTPARRSEPGLKNLRTARVMERNIAITVEPGIYFRDFLLNGEFGDSLKIDLKYLNRERIAEY